MMRAPAFWDRDGMLPLLLSPASLLVARATARRVARPGWTAPVPVICCGAATVGGAGKTTLVIDLARRLAARGVAVHILTRGYGGTSRGARRARPDDDAATAGDEALLLAAEAPTWTGADRADSARAAIMDGAQALLMDDGLQNPTLRRSFSILVVDGPSGFGNGRVLPAGPLREPAAVAAARCEAAVVIGDGEAGVALPTFRTRLVASSPLPAGGRVIAFAGIGRPEKFFASVRALGLVPVAERAFSDHHRYTDAELARLLAEAASADAALVTTAKDAVRLPTRVRETVRVIGVRLAWDDQAAPDALLAQALRSV
jgi:tetraacyldisaccharide 4'-kinase